MKPSRTTAFRDIAILTGIAIVIFYPLFYTHYFYTDEIVQLWLYRKGSGFHMFDTQGRIVTEFLSQSLFGSIDTISQLSRLRIFSFLGWILCIPLWYTIISTVTRKEGLSALLPFFSVLYLITCPPFCTSVSWASCMELFIANTSGLIAGYLLYAHIKYEEGRMTVSTRWIILCLIFGVLSLATYQSGFACFLLPFLLQAISKKGLSRTIIVGVVIYLLTYVIYYLLFRFYLKHTHFDAINRADFHFDPWGKLLFLLARPMNSAFHFTWIVNERNIFGKIVYLLLLMAFLVVNFFILLRPRPLAARVRYLVTIFCFFPLLYVPSLVVAESYGSNRTLLAIEMAVFILVFCTLMALIRNEQRQRTVAIIIGGIFVINAWYNFRYQFLGPVKKEYDLVRNYIEVNYTPGTDTVGFIRPPENLFQRKYGINTSWDEFGVPGTFFKWVPEFFVKQVVFEKTGNRRMADSLVVTDLTPPDNPSDPARSISTAEPPVPAKPKGLAIDVESIELNNN